MAAMTPTAIRRWIALEMKRLREDAGIDRIAAAERIGKASTVIAHIETARNLPAPADLEILLHLYGAPDLVPTFRDLLRVAKRGKDWWMRFSGAFHSSFNLYYSLESGAAQIRVADLTVIFGLFQTADYAKAILQPAGSDLSAAEVEERVKLRMARQEAALGGEGRTGQIHSVLDEGVLRRQVGGRAVMREQLGHLVELAARPNIDIRVLPFKAGAHPATDGSFIIFDYPEEFRDDPGIVFVENRRQGLYYESRESVDDYRETFARLQQQALGTDESTGFIKSMKREMR